MPEAVAEAPKSPRRPFAIVAYLRGLWRGEPPLARVFWTDMVLIGTLVNLLATIAALLLFVSGAPIAFGVVTHFAPVPYNILLLLAVWRSAAREASAWSFPAQAAALAWLVLSFVV